jgi:Raf kinase inhibitor-like YbhB/YbcL family protein
MALELQIDGIADGQPIPPRFAFCAGDAMGDNISPALSWSGAPEGTRSFVVTCVDPDAPTDATDVNVEGRTVPASLPRADFAHWLLADLPSDRAGLAEGEAGSGIVAKGKAVGSSCGGVAGRNDYTSWFEGDADMGGTYGGYDGPCPPANDEIVHRYDFTVHAVDIATVGLSGDFGLEDLRAAIDGHVLASATVTGTYTLDPALG